MIDVIYYFNIFTCLSMGLALLTIQTAPRLQDKHYRTAKRFLGVASIIVAVGNAVILLQGVAAQQVEVLSAPVLIVSQLQAALFTFAVLTLFHSEKVNQYYILKCLSPTFAFAVLYALSVLLFSEVKTYSVSEHIDNLTNPTLALRTIYGFIYLIQIILYIRLFRRERKIYIAKIENYFSDTDKYNLGWATQLFYQASGIGLVVFVFSIFSGEIFDAVLTIVVTYLYFNFAVRYINYQYRLYYALPAVENVCEEAAKPENGFLEFNQSLEKALAGHQLFLKQGVALADYAEALGIAERKLSCYINSTYGMSFKQWINRQRVEHAKELKTDNPEMTMEQIAELSGFANRSHLSRILKESAQKLIPEAETTKKA